MTTTDITIELKSQAEILTLAEDYTIQTAKLAFIMETDNPFFGERDEHRAEGIASEVASIRNVLRMIEGIPVSQDVINALYRTIAEAEDLLTEAWAVDLMNKPEEQVAEIAF